MQNSQQQQPDINDIIKALPLKQKVPVLALKKLLDQREVIDQQQDRKIIQTRMAYSKKIQPLLARASQIIRGNPLKPEQIAGVEQLLKPTQKQRLQQYRKGKSIPDYWISVFSNSALVDEINENDQKALKHLVDVERVDEENDPESIKIKFTFKSNPYFKQTQISRKLDVKNGIALCLEGDSLTWKEGQCLTHTMKTVKNKKNGQKMVIQGQKIKSFFDIFLNWDQKNQQMLEHCASNVTQISNLLIFDSVDYFLGVINADQESQDQDDEDDDREQCEGDQE